MKFPKTIAIMALLSFVAVLSLYHVGVAQSFTNLRIISPVNGAKITTDFVRITYELVNPAATAEPTYKLQLDTQAPVQTKSTEHTFTGLAPGRHTILIELVDANGTPIDSAVNAVQFTIEPPSQAGTPSGEARTSTPELQRVAQGGRSDQNRELLPSTGNALPLISVIGFGVLLGGIVSALRTR